MFGSKSRRMNILNNTIDVASYQTLNQVDRQLERSKLGIPAESIVIGHVGRFSESKNQLFILKLLHHLHQNGSKRYSYISWRWSVKTEDRGRG